MSEVVAREKVTLRIFISYSRKDEDFAQDLLAGLEAAGFEPYLDTQNIAAGEDWEARLSGLIEAADTVVFILSPDAVVSQRCAWEVERTSDLQKRLLPVVWRAVEDDSVPQRLKQLNYIFFNRPHSFGVPLRVLANALRTDISWVREHTRIGESALRWNAKGRVDALLQRGEELAAAKGWLNAQPKYAPEPTLLHLEFIKAGEDAELARATSERQRLSQIAAAQDDREKAIEREKVALERADAALQQAEMALRKKQRGQVVIRTLLSFVILGLIGWINQSFLMSRLNWHLTMQPYMATNFRPYVTTPEFTLALKPGQAFKECASNCPEMVVIPVGSLTMGSPETESDRSSDEGPQRLVTFSQPFAVSKFPVTFDEWNACVAVGGCPKVSDSGFGEATRPVINVNWEEAQIYVAWLSLMTGKRYRLPSEAEWEYAARAGGNSVYAWGDNLGIGNANCIGCGSQWDNQSSSPVGSFKPNLFGLYDVEGNIWQWVADCYHENYSGGPIDGSSWTNGCQQSRRSVRGGGWDSYAKNIRVANRDRISTGNRLNDLGFRVALTLSP